MTLLRCEAYFVSTDRTSFEPTAWCPSRVVKPADLVWSSIWRARALSAGASDGDPEFAGLSTQATKAHLKQASCRESHSRAVFCPRASHRRKIGSDRENDSYICAVRSSYSRTHEGRAMPLAEHSKKTAARDEQRRVRLPASVLIWPAGSAKWRRSCMSAAPLRRGLWNSVGVRIADRANTVDAASCSPRAC